MQFLFTLQRLAFMTRHQFFPACPPFVNTVYRQNEVLINWNKLLPWLQLSAYEFSNKTIQTTKIKTREHLFKKSHQLTHYIQFITDLIFLRGVVRNKIESQHQIIFDQDSCNGMFPTQASFVSHSLRIAWGVVDF